MIIGRCLDLTTPIQQPGMPHVLALAQKPQQEEQISLGQEAYALKPLLLGAGIELGNDGVVLLEACWKSGDHSWSSLLGSSGTTLELVSVSITDVAASMRLSHCRLLLSDSASGPL